MDEPAVELVQYSPETLFSLEPQKPINIELTPVNIRLPGPRGPDISVPMVVDVHVGDDGIVTRELVVYLWYLMDEKTKKITEKRILIPEQGGTVGREGSLIKFTGEGFDFVSREHLIVSHEGELKDKYSTNGTWYSPVEEPQNDLPLNPGQFYKLPTGEASNVFLGPVLAVFSVNKENKQLTININGQTLSLAPGVYEIGRNNGGLSIWRGLSSCGDFKDIGDSDAVSRRHAALVFDGETAYIMDLASKNGVKYQSSSLETRKGGENIKKISVSSSGATIKGPAEREDNQDSFYAGSVINYADAPKREFSLPSGVHLAIIADGMGGLPNGKEASSFVVYKLLEIINQTAQDKKLRDINEKWLRCQVNIINRELKNNHPGAGTTLTFVLTVDEIGKTFVVSIGDSRVYLVNPKGEKGKKVILLTRDQTVAWQQYIQQESLQGGRTLNDFFRQGGLNILTRYLGGEEGVGVDIQGDIQVVELENEGLAGKSIVLVTDGVWNAVPPKKIHRVSKDFGEIRDEYQLRIALGRLFLSYNLAGLDLENLNPEEILKKIEKRTRDNATAAVVRFD